MIEVLTNWWTGLLVMSAIALLAVSFIMQLHEWGIRPLRDVFKILNRPWFERLLLLFFVCGMVQYAATKGTGSGSRSSGTETRDDTVDEIEMTALRSGNSQESGEVTNLCFTGIAVLTNGVELNIAWPTNFFDLGTTLDFFAKYHSITNAWQWFAYSSTSSGMTNLTVVADWQTNLGCASNPPVLFFKVQDRATCAATMADADGDGLPDVYELNNGTNPYVSDYALAPKLTVGDGGDYGTISAALATSTNYSIVELSSEVESLDQTVVLPSHPVLMTGPRDGYARLYSSANIAAFLLDDGQDSETVFRNLYVVLTARSNFQSAFWIGGNLPWCGVGASPTFENVRVRALYPNVLHYGWHYYRDDAACSSLSNCSMNAAGSTSAIGLYSYGGPNIVTSECAFVNFPTNAGNYASWIKAETNVVATLPTADVNLSWAGYALDQSYSSTTDSDGDGLSYYAEIHDHNTDPWLSDSDGDGLTDSEEVDAGTDPKDLYSFYRRVTVVTTVTDYLANTTNYVAWGTSATGWETNDQSSCWTFPATNVYDMISSSGPMYVKSFRDLNCNGQYDSEIDIILITQVPPLDAISSFTLCFGDVDGDGVPDATERQEGTDPYDSGSFRLRATVNCANTDIANGVTNYLRVVGSSENGGVSFIASGTLTVDAILTNGICEVFCLRDFNGNGAFDEGVDIRYSRTLTKSDNGKSISITIGDADSDGQSDSSERSHGTNPADARSYCFSISLVEKGIFSTTNALTAEILFGTNVIVGPLTMTNRIWEVDVGHLVTSNRESVVAYLWDDANSNGVRDAEECYARQVFTIKGHDNVLTNALSMGTFDRDGDGMLDYWENLHVDAGLSPTNAADAFLDADSDGLINLHEYWAHCNPFVPDGSNTVLSIMARSVDDLLTENSSGRHTKFADHHYGSVLNTNCWCFTVDTSCASPANSWFGAFKAGTAVTSRHVVLANHYWLRPNDRISFLGTNGVSYSRTIIATNRVESSDILVCLLDDDLPNSVLPAKILPRNYYSYIRTGCGLPGLMFDFSEHAIVSEFSHLPEHCGSVDGRVPVNQRRLRYFEEVESGDSGDPKFLLFGNSAILVCTLHVYGTGKSGAGPFLTSWADKLQEVLDRVSDENSVPRRQLNYFDFSNYEKIADE